MRHENGKGTYRALRAVRGAIPTVRSAKCRASSVRSQNSEF